MSDTSIERLTAFCDEFERVNAKAKPTTADDFYAINGVECCVSDIRAILALLPAETPRVVTTVAELEALPHGTILRGREGQAYLVIDAGIFASGSGVRQSPLMVEAVGLPATVLTPARTVRATCGCDLTGELPPAIHLVDNHEGTPAPEREPVTAEQAFDVFVRSFNGDEAGDIDDVSALDGNTGWAMRGGNDVRAVFDKAIAALLPAEQVNVTADPTGLVEVAMFRYDCTGCGTPAKEFSEYVAWESPDSAQEDAEACEWEFREVDGIVKALCPDCAANVQPGGESDAV